MNDDKLILKNLISEINSILNTQVSEYSELLCIRKKLKKCIYKILEYLYKFNADNFKDAMVDLVSYKGFDEATETLLKLYNDKNNGIDKWNIGDALYSIQDNKYEEQYIEIVKNKENGVSRQMITILLGKLKCEKSIPVLIELLEDDDVNGHAIMALGYFKDKKIIQHIEPFIKHKKIWIRKEAEKSIKKISK